jgi:hypothetical protein
MRGDSVEAAAFAGLVAATACLNASAALLLVALRFLALTLTRPPRRLRRSLTRTLPCLIGGVLTLAGAGMLLGFEFALMLALIWRTGAESDASARFAAFRARRPFGAARELGLNRLGPFWAVPVLGVAHQIGAPEQVVWILAAVAGFILVDWAIRRLADWRIGLVDATSVAHIASHNLVFAVAGLAMPDPTAALMVLLGYRAALCAPVATWRLRALPASRLHAAA